MEGSLGEIQFDVIHNRNGFYVAKDGVNLTAHASKEHANRVAAFLLRTALLHGENAVLGSGLIN
jgi:hypothetical protein